MLGLKAYYILRITFTDAMWARHVRCLSCDKKKKEGGGRGGAQASLLIQEIGPRDRSSTALCGIFSGRTDVSKAAAKNGPPDASNCLLRFFS
jgi:hypothetical protein